MTINRAQRWGGAGLLLTLAVLVGTGTAQAAQGSGNIGIFQLFAYGRHCDDRQRPTNA